MTTSDQDSHPSIEADFSSNESVDRLAQRIRHGHRTWLERLQEMEVVDARFRSELISTHDPEEALTLCNQWIGKWMEMLSADSQALVGFENDLGGDAAACAEGSAFLLTKGER